MSEAGAVIDRLRAEHDALAALVRRFGDDELAGPSGSSEWDVSQVLSHLGSGAEINRARLSAALAGGDYPGAGFNESVWDRWNALGRRERADGFLRENEALTALYESLDAAARDTLRIDLGFLPAPVDVATAGRMRLNELTLHSWDVRVAADPGACLPAQTAEVLLHAEPSLIGWIGTSDALEGRTAVLRLTTTDPDSQRALHLASPVAVSRDVPADVDGDLRLPAEAWLRLVAGRLRPEHTADGVTASGAADLDLLRRVFPGY